MGNHSRQLVVLSFVVLLVTACQQEQNNVSARIYYQDMVRCSAAFMNLGKALGKTGDSKFMGTSGWLNGMAAASGDLAGISREQRALDERQAREDGSLRPPTGFDFVRMEEWVKGLCQRNGPKSTTLMG